MSSLSFSQTSLAIVSAFLVSLIGVFPVYFMRNSEDALLSGTTMNRWLSFATGSLIGDVFLNLVPETLISFQDHTVSPVAWASFVIGGIIVFYSIEKIAFLYTTSSCEKPSKHLKKNKYDNGICNSKASLKKNREISVDGAGIIGYLNLAANSLDNFSHGMSIGASYLVSIRCGLLTTLCILIHEIPHEISDFVILLRSGFSKWEAAKAQFMTALTSLLGTLFTLFLNCQDACLMGILPFTAGGFLYIALVSLLPIMLQEKCMKESFILIVILLVGVISMYILTCVHA